MPRIADILLKTVVFLYPSREDAEKGKRSGGSGSLFGVSSHNPRIEHIYAVTNSHVIMGGDGGAPVVRLNGKDGKPRIIDLDASLWTHHSDGVDIAVCRLEVGADHDFKYINVENDFVSPEIIRSHNLGPGDDVVMVGRLLDVPEGKKNRPVMRFGSIAQMPDDEVPISSDVLGPQVSFLVEMHSRSGFSGSPVHAFIPPSPVRMDSDGLDLQADEFYGPWLLGIEWGQIGTRDPKGEGWYASSMLGVVPAWYLRELLLEDAWLIEQRQNAERNFEESAVGRAESAEPPTKADNPRHEEDFNSLLDAAAKGRKSGDQS